MIIIPIIMNEGKKTGFYNLLEKNAEIPIKKLKRAIGKKHYYAFKEHIDNLNELVKNIHPEKKSPFAIEWGTDSVTGRDIKILKRNPEARLYTVRSDIMLTF